jgi:hypothetical protein
MIPGAIAVALSLVTPTAQGHRMTLGEILVFTPSPSKPEGNSKAYALQADRGSRKGQYMVVSMADAKPGGISGGASAQSSEYHLLSPDKVDSLPEVDVLGIHYIKVRPDRREAFERFVSEKIHPAVGNLRPDLRLLYYKAVRGPDAGNYITVFALTRESRDKYWPGGSDSDDLRAAFKPVQALTNELSTYLVEGSALTDPKFAAAVYESREWSDFVLMPPGTSGSKR